MKKVIPLTLQNLSADSARVLLLFFNASFAHCCSWKQTKLTMNLSFTGFRFFVCAENAT